MDVIIETIAVPVLAYLLWRLGDWYMDHRSWRIRTESVI